MARHETVARPGPTGARRREESIEPATRGAAGSCWFIARKQDQNE